MEVIGVQEENAYAQYSRDPRPPKKSGRIADCVRSHCYALTQAFNFRLLRLRHPAQFETEFTAMKQVAQSLSDVKVIWLKLHPIQFGRNDIALDVDEGIELLRKATEAFHEKLEEWALFIEIGDLRRIQPLLYRSGRRMQKVESWQREGRPGPEL